MFRVTAAKIFSEKFAPFLIKNSQISTSLTQRLRHQRKARQKPLSRPSSSLAVVPRTLQATKTHLGSPHDIDWNRIVGQLKAGEDFEVEIVLTKIYFRGKMKK